MPESVEVPIGVVRAPEPSRSVISYNEVVKPCFLEAYWRRIYNSLWTFANTGEDRDAPTLWAQGYDDSESYLVMHLRNVKLQTLILCV